MEGLFSCLLFYVFLFLHQGKKRKRKENQGPTGAGEVWPGTRQTWLAFLTPLDARKRSEKKTKASAEAGEVIAGYWANLAGVPDAP